MEIGVCFVPTRHLVCTKSTATNSKPCTRNTKREVEHVKQSKPKNSGTQSSNLKPKRATPSCCTRMLVTVNPTNKTSEPSNVPTSVPKSSNTLLPMKLPYVTWRVSLFPHLSNAENSISRKCTMSSKSSQTISTRLSTSIIIPSKKLVDPTCVIDLSELVFKGWRMRSWL